VSLTGFLLGFVLVLGLGILTGILTGLSPGLHVNNVAALLLATQDAWVSLIALFVPDASADSATTGLLLSCFLLATATSHAVFDFIPSVFLGAPTEDTALATMPGHRLLLAGQGAKAVALAARGALLGSVFGLVALLPLHALLADPVGIADRFRPFAGAFLAAVLGALVISELRGRNRVRRVLGTIWVQGLAGLLGLATLRGSMPLDPGVILFPLFSGLFGIPTLLLGLRARRGQIPAQRIEPIRGTSREDVRSALRGTLAGASISWLPGLSGGAAAALASLGRRRNLGPSQFMVVLGAVSTSTTILSVAVLFMIQRARSGAAAAVRVLLGEPAPWTVSLSAPFSLLLLTVSAVLATTVAAPLAVRFARWLADHVSRSDPRRVSVLSLSVIIVLLAVSTGVVGLGLAAISTIVGLVPVALRVRRVHLMASLLVPVLFTYLIGVP